MKTAGTLTGAVKPLRVGVIGAGVMGSNHARVFMTLPGVTLVGIADPLEVHRKRAIDLIGCRTFPDIDSLLAEGVDAVTIAAPTHLHHEIALGCMARKIDVLVEKPIASTVEEGREIVAGAKRAGVTLIEYLVNTSALKGPRTLLCAAPLKIPGADGAPARVFAIEGLPQ